MRQKKNCTTFVYRSVLCAVIVGCSAVFFAQDDSGTGEQSSEIIIRGSKNLMPSAEIWVAAYTGSNETPTIDIEATGTSKGIEDLLAGRAHIAMASRPITAEELSAAQKNDLTVRETVVARLGIAVVVKKGHPVRSLPIETVAAIFAGDIDNWQACGGPDQSITVIRKTSGWSSGFFRERIMGDAEYSESTVIVASHLDVVAEVAGLPGAIGYAAMPEVLPALDSIDLIRIVSDSSDADATFALSRPLFLYTIEGEQSVEPFLEFTTGPEAQKMIMDTGFYPAAQTDPLAGG